MARRRLARCAARPSCLLGGNGGARRSAASGPGGAGRLPPSRPCRPRRPRSTRARPATRVTSGSKGARTATPGAQRWAQGARAPTATSQWPFRTSWARSSSHPRPGGADDDASAVPCRARALGVGPRLSGFALRAHPPRLVPPPNARRGTNQPQEGGVPLTNTGRSPVHPHGVLLSAGKEKRCPSTRTSRCPLTVDTLTERFPTLDVAFVHARDRRLPREIASRPNVFEVAAADAKRYPVVVGTLDKLGDAYARRTSQPSTTWSSTKRSRQTGRSTSRSATWHSATCSSVTTVSSNRSRR